VSFHALTYVTKLGLHKQKDFFHLTHRDVFMEKHWKSVISRSVCDYFFDAQNKASRFVSRCIKVVVDVFLCHC